MSHTEWNVMVWVNRYVLIDLDIIYALENCESVADACDAHFLKLIMAQGDEGLPNDVIFCTKTNVSPVSLTGSIYVLPTNNSVAVLPQPKACNKLSAFFCGPFSNYGTW